MVAGKTCPDHSGHGASGATATACCPQSPPGQPSPGWRKGNHQFLPEESWNTEPGPTLTTDHQLQDGLGGLELLHVLIVRYLHKCQVWVANVFFPLPYHFRTLFYKKSPVIPCSQRSQRRYSMNKSTSKREDNLEDAGQKDFVFPWQILLPTIHQLGSGRERTQLCKGVFTTPKTQQVMIRVIHQEWISFYTKPLHPTLDNTNRFMKCKELQKNFYLNVNIFSDQNLSMFLEKIWIVSKLLLDIGFFLLSLIICVFCST